MSEEERKKVDEGPGGVGRVVGRLEVLDQERRDRVVEEVAVERIRSRAAEATEDGRAALKRLGIDLPR